MAQAPDALSRKNRWNFKTQRHEKMFWVVDVNAAVYI